jgi:hypothetical protein
MGIKKRYGVIFSEQPPSTQWAALTYRGVAIAEVWFKPEGEPFGLTFRIPSESFQTSGIGQRLTAEILLRAVAIAPDEVESWRIEGVGGSGMDGAGPGLRQPLRSPGSGVTHLNVFISLKPPLQAAAPIERQAQEIPAGRWQDLENRWKTIESLEATVDTLRLRMEGLRAEMEAASRRTLNTEEKTHALNADVAQWNKVKGRLHYAVPKVKDFIQRATWSLSSPERKNLEELFKNDNPRQITLVELDKVRDQLEILLKDRQVLSTVGATTFQECQSLAAEVQGAFRTLQSNAAARAQKKLNAARQRGK